MLAILYTHDSNFIVDIDECLIDNGRCAHTCDNTDGSYQCSCWDGYELTSDGHNCTGIMVCIFSINYIMQLLYKGGPYTCTCTSAVAKCLILALPF